MTQDYFLKLQAALKRAALAEPVLVLDQPRLDANIKQLRAALPHGMAYRIVAKSLPCAKLIARVAARAKTDRLMAFNTHMAHQLLQLMPDADQLMGKPVPCAAVQGFFKSANASEGQRGARNIQWLVDTPTRLHELDALAKKLKLPLRVNLEIDVGLHRGGMAAGGELQNALTAVKASKYLTLAGYMGYEPHLTKLPTLGGWRKRAQSGARDVFATALEQGRAVFGDAHIEAMVRNMAGSPTFALYKDTHHANELAAGSALVKPSDFDIPLLRGFTPAAFIATPAIKVSRGVRLPALEYANKLLGKPRAGTSIFIHGGYWMAAPIFPSGLKNSTLFGRSSNQEMFIAPRNTALAVDDFVFLRPTQSEAVFLQFPKIAVFDGRRIADIWHPLAVSA